MITHNTLFYGEVTKTILHLSSDILLIWSSEITMFIFGIQILQIMQANTEGMFMTLNLSLKALAGTTSSSKEDFVSE